MKAEKVMDSISLRQGPYARAAYDGLLVQPRRHCYFTGEQVNAIVFGLDGRYLGEERFQVSYSPGSGFGGQVYQALPMAGVIGDTCKGDAFHPVALKVLVPQATGKRVFRDLLFRLSYQTGFAPRLREEALRCGLIWQELIRTAAGLEFGTDSLVTRPYGYFWDTRLASYVEIHQWVDGRAVRYEVDDGLLLRWLGRTTAIPDTEVSRKRACMVALVQLCQKMGAVGLARQYEWYTLVSQANMLTRTSRYEGQGEFTGVDWRPGLAVPFFLPLSPVHARLIWHGFSRGVYVHYDEVDFKRLESYVQAHEDIFKPLVSLIRQLKIDDAHYRAGLPDLWSASDSLLRRREAKQFVKPAAVGDWRRLDRISQDEEARILASKWRFYTYFLLDNLPLVGGKLMCWLGNADYRRHVLDFWRVSAYRWETLAAQRSCDLLDWETRRRISQAHAKTLDGSMGAYLVEKITLSWLPRGMQRFFTDSNTRRQLVQALVVGPVRLLIDEGFRRSWLDEILAQQMQKGIVTPQQVDRLRAQAGERRMQSFLRDAGLTIGLELFAKLLYILLGVYGFRTRNFLPLGVAILSPIAPSGIVRAIYVLVQWILELPAILRSRDYRLFRTRLLGMAAAPWRFVGNLFAPLEMFAYYSEMSLVLGDYLASKMAAMVPVLGGRGKILEYWMLNLTYNLPLSLKRFLEERNCKEPKNAKLTGDKNVRTES